MTPRSRHQTQNSGNYDPYGHQKGSTSVDVF
eukprot:CAMPEP_0197441578 /NCGR_PEP_ID=MMETSP1175-20131217/7824_1 /TAXON_ID=1003142 /ORGANISM="Triceratium dubium, Strain CCMP147" /LENGTH=30 /DNA_ID= /DNA_START= /DNA_END= /DNA_ORIENTATION=